MSSYLKKTPGEKLLCQSADGTFYPRKRGSTSGTDTVICLQTKKKRWPRKLGMPTWRRAWRPNLALLTIQIANRPKSPLCWTGMKRQIIRTLMGMPGRKATTFAAKRRPLCICAHFSNAILKSSSNQNWTPARIGVAAKSRKPKPVPAPLRTEAWSDLQLWTQL